MRKDKVIKLEFSGKRVEKIEYHPRKINSEEVVQGFIALVSAHQSSNQTIELKPPAQDEDGENSV